MSVLVVEDERDLSDLLSYILRRTGHDVIQAYDGETALRLWRETRPSLVLLDIGLPHKNGWDVCRAIRRESTTPIMIISGADTEEDIIQGLELGAEDYITKPFSPRLLQARIRCLLRRGQADVGSQLGASIKFGDLELNFEGRTITCVDASARLTRIECRILQELAIHSGQVMPHEDLIHQVWGYKGEVSSSILKGHVRNLRLKLAEINSRTSVRIILGVGYILTANVEEPVLTHA